MPRWSDSTYPEFVSIGEVLDWMVQLIYVCTPWLFWGLYWRCWIKCPQTFRLSSSCTAIKLHILWVHLSRKFGMLAPELRSSFPAKYVLINFGHSIEFCTDVSNWLAKVLGLYPESRVRQRLNMANCLILLPPMYIKRDVQYLGGVKRDRHISTFPEFGCWLQVPPAK